MSGQRNKLRQLVLNAWHRIEQAEQRYIDASIGTVHDSKCVCMLMADILNTCCNHGLCGSNKLLYSI